MVHLTIFTWISCGGSQNVRILIDEALVNLLGPEISGNSFRSTELRRFGSSEGGRRKNRELEVTAPGCTFSLRCRRRSCRSESSQFMKSAIGTTTAAETYNTHGSWEGSNSSRLLDIDTTILRHRDLDCHRYTESDVELPRCSGQRIVEACNFVSNLRKLLLGRKLTIQSYRCFNHPSMLPNQYAYNA